MENIARPTVKRAFDLLALTCWVLTLCVHYVISDIIKQQDTSVCEYSDAVFHWSYSWENDEPRWTRLRFNNSDIARGRQFSMAQVADRKEYQGRYEQISLNGTKFSFRLKNVTKADEGMYELCFSLESGDNVFAQGNLTIASKSQDDVKHCLLHDSCTRFTCGKNETKSVKWIVNGKKLSNTNYTIKYCGSANDVVCFLDDVCAIAKVGADQEDQAQALTSSGDQTHCSPPTDTNTEGAGSTGALLPAVIAAAIGAVGLFLVVVVIYRYRRSRRRKREKTLGTKCEEGHHLNGDTAQST